MQKLTHSINEINIDHIKNLSDGELSQLLHILLKIEAEKNSLEKWKIEVPQNITVADGGEDGRIEWSGNPSFTKWLKNKHSVFQCKATPLPPAKCFEEILEKETSGKPRKLKSQIEDVVLRKGRYILFTNQDLNASQKSNRIKQFRNAIKATGKRNHTKQEIEILDANSIKDWVNENVAAVTFVQGCNGITRPFKFRTWSEWENDMPGSEIPFQTNDILLENIKQIRSGLKKANVIRVIGHSGLGKTRMILETFREDPGAPEIVAQQSQIVYYDMGTGTLDNIIGYILSHRTHQSGILVIDNCNEENHIAISTLVKSNSNFKLITIDFSSETTERSVIKLDRNNQRDIVQKIIDENFGDSLTKTDKEFLTKRSEGFPQMAIIFANSVSSSGIEKLHSQLPEDFLKKLVFGRNKESEREYEIIKACSVLSNFGFIDDNIREILTLQEIEKLDKQTEFVRKKICGQIEGTEVSTKEFYKACLKYKKTNILEQRGSKLMVKPTPLAITLATEWWKETPHVLIKEILSELTNNELGKCLVERLTELDQLDKAKEIVNELWGPNSPFVTAEVLNTSLGSLLFRYVVEVNPVSTTEALVQSFGNLSKKEIQNIHEGRRNLVWALEKLCFRKETFQTASKILYSFAVSENETWANNSTNQFIHLFQLRLPGTEVPLTERLEVLKWGLEKNDNDYTRIAILAMSRGLENDHFTRSLGAEKQGSGASLKDYIPKSLVEINEYKSQQLDLLVKIACSKNKNAKLAEEKIADSIQTMIRNGHYNLIIKSIHEVLKKKGDTWPEALINLKRTLAFEKALQPETVDDLKTLISQLTPTDLKNQIFLKITKPEWDVIEKDEKGNYIDKPRLDAEVFANKIIVEKIDLKDYLVDLLEGEQRQGFYFGAKIGELSTDPEKLIEESISTLKKVNKEKQNPEFIAGLLFGLGDKTITEKTIKKFIHDTEIQQHAFYLTKANNSTFKDINKLFLLVDKYGYSINQFKIFQYGRSLENLNKKEVNLLVDKIASYGNSGKWIALSLLYMFSFGSEKNWNSTKGKIKDLISKSNLLIEFEGTFRMETYHWSDSVIKILNSENDEKFAQIISKQIIEFCSHSKFDLSFDTYLRNVIKILFDKHFDATWEYFGKGIISEYLTFFHLAHLIGSKNGFYNDDQGLAFQNPLHYPKLLGWCKKHSQIAPKRMARMMPLEDLNEKKVTWNSFSKELIDEHGDNKEFLRELEANMGSFGSVGSSVPYYLRKKKLLEVLTNHKIQKVRNWASSMIKYIDRTIKRENLEDHDRFLS